MKLKRIDKTKVRYNLSLTYRQVKCLYPIMKEYVNKYERNMTNPYHCKLANDIMRLVSQL